MNRRHESDWAPVLIAVVCMVCLFAGVVWAGTR